MLSGLIQCTSSYIFVPFLHLCQPVICIVVIPSWNKVFIIIIITIIIILKGYDSNLANTGHWTNAGLKLCWHIRRLTNNYPTLGPYLVLAMYIAYTITLDVEKRTWRNDHRLYSTCHACAPGSNPAVPARGFQRNIVSPFSMWLGDHVNGGPVESRLRPVALYRR